MLGAAWGWVLVSPAPVQIWGRGCGVRLLWQKLCEGLDPSITCNVDCVNNPGGYDCEKVGARATSAPGLGLPLHMHITCTSAPGLRPPHDCRAETGLIVPLCMPEGLAAGTRL